MMCKGSAILDQCLYYDLYSSIRFSIRPDILVLYRRHDHTRKVEQDASLQPPQRRAVHRRCRRMRPLDRIFAAIPTQVRRQRRR